MSSHINLQELPIDLYNDIWVWLYNNDIGDMRKQVDDTGGYANTVTMSDEEATLLVLKWS